MLCAILSCVASRASAGPGDLDLTFGVGGKLRLGLSVHDDEAYGLAVDPQGRILTAGRVYRDQSKCNAMLVRLLPDGRLDQSFGSGGKLVLGKAAEFAVATAVSVKPDGRILVLAYLESEMQGRWVLAQVLDSGRLDPSFGTGGRIELTFDDAAAVAGATMLVKRDGRIVIGGSGSTEPKSLSPTVTILTRLFPDGRPDFSFGTDAHVVIDALGGIGLAEQGDGKIVVVGGLHQFTLLRLLSDGSPDASFGADGVVETPVPSGRTSDDASAVGIGPDGKIVVGGTSWGHFGRDMTLARYLTNGALDPTFGTGGRVTTEIGRFDSQGFALSLARDGRILLGGDVVVGDFRHPRLPQAQFALVRYLPDGSLDTSFGDGGVARAAIGRRSAVTTSIAFQSNGNVLAAGYAYSADDNSDSAFASFEW